MKYMEKDIDKAMPQMCKESSEFTEFIRRSSSQNEDLIHLKYKLEAVLASFRGNVENRSSECVADPADKSDTGSFGRIQELHNERGFLINSIGKMIDELDRLIG